MSRTGNRKSDNTALEPVLPGAYRPGLIVFSALLCRAAFPTLDLWPCAWFCLVPFLFAIAGARARAAFGGGVLFGFVHMVSLAWWVFSALYGHTGAGLYVSLLFVIVIGALLGLYYGLFAVLASLILRARMACFARAAGCAAAWVCVEYLRAHLFSGAPWELLGCSQYRVLPLIQVADITGVYGLSFLLVFANCCLYQACWELPAARTAVRRLAPALALVAVVLL